ncbi:MAG: hypothetical protein IH892_22050 [Planctomycetes bacterium]|nr:hypothetical protein [Planctomycetota bacterium]
MTISGKSPIRPWDTRNYRTDLTVQSGQTVVLGGMVQQVKQEIERKVPILGDILSGGSKGGIIKTPFTVRGTFSDPKVSAGLR